MAIRGAKMPALKLYQEELLLIKEKSSMKKLSKMLKRL